MTVKISKPAINLREELASLRNQGGLPKEDKLYLDNLVDNGDFSAGTTGWSIVGSGASAQVVNGELVITRNGTGAHARQSIPTEIGKTYILSVDLTAATGAASIGVKLDSSMSEVGSTLKTYTVIHTATSTTTLVDIITYNTSNGTITVDNVSVQEVGENLVTNGTFDYDSGWTLGTNASISGGTLSYSGGSGNVTSYQNIGLEANKTYHITATVSGYVQGHLSFRAGGNTTDTPDITANGTYSFVFTVPSNGNNNFMIDASTTFVGSIDNITVTEGTHPVIQNIPYGYDVKDVYIDGELAREGEAYDYQVQTDGSNQWLKPTVEPTATTETVVIGVRK